MASMEFFSSGSVKFFLPFNCHAAIASKGFYILFRISIFHLFVLIGTTSWCSLVLSLCVGLCAMLSKEQGITVFGVSLAYDIFVLSKVT